jgi:hypothetical protein
MDNQYTNESDNEEDVNDDVEDIHPGDELVNYFNNGLNYDDDNDDKDDDEKMIGTWVIMTMHMSMPMKEHDST